MILLSTFTMKKIVEWLLVLSLISSDCGNLILNWLPFHLLFIFGTVSVLIILYRTYSFNDCPEASTELMKLVSEAKKDLAGRGFVFES
ncbi:unnamed protein product [Schistosoma margrebowiei]|uniref:Dolichol-phosphate mannosyltransferase subunit 3 n=1 Tax=Schistosoma margrebowiei TaxID=48269 RepID=A0A3P7W542_9TREM|nr:unnamed protein product [Schistosoma margrebowiei]